MSLSLHQFTIIHNTHTKGMKFLLIYFLFHFFILTGTFLLLIIRLLFKDLKNKRHANITDNLL